MSFMKIEIEDKQDQGAGINLKKKGKLFQMPIFKTTNFSRGA